MVQDLLNYKPPEQDQQDPKTVRHLSIINTRGFLGQIRQISSQFHFRAFELKLFASPVVTAFQIQNSVIQFRFQSSQIPLALCSI